MHNFNLKTNELPGALEETEALAGYVFKNRELLMEALRHPSYASEQPVPLSNNQRMEFLGDAVLQIILSDYLYQAAPDAQEGELTKMRSFLANEKANAGYTACLKLDRVLLLGHGECLGGGRERPSILGDVFEAFLGAVYLDGGLEEARRLVLSLLPDLNYVRGKLVLEDNPKGALQEFCQEYRLGIPEYEVIAKTGPSHMPVYDLRILLGGRELARGTGSSQKLAQRQAATAAYTILSREHEQQNKVVVALDFDGVICDSAAETAASGWKAAKKIWAGKFRQTLPTKKAVAAFRAVRPYLETGYQAVLMMAMIREGISAEEIGKNYETHAARLMEETGLDKEALVKLFGEIRDKWIQENLDEWISWNAFYPGVNEALGAILNSGCKVKILTTKQERFVNAMFEKAGIKFPAEEIYGLERKVKKETLLAKILESGAKEVHFVEDRLKTLQRVEGVKDLDAVKLYYADWGYGTAENLAAAKADDRLKVLGLEEFTAWLAGMK